jgi:hypothetical protein
MPKKQLVEEKESLKLQGDKLLDARRANARPRGGAPSATGRPMGQQRGKRRK